MSDIAIDLDPIELEYFNKNSEKYKLYTGTIPNSFEYFMLQLELIHVNGELIKLEFIPTAFEIDWDIIVNGDLGYVNFESIMDMYKPSLSRLSMWSDNFYLFLNGLSLDGYLLNNINCYKIRSDIKYNNSYKFIGSINDKFNLEVKFNYQNLLRKYNIDKLVDLFNNQTSDFVVISPQKTYLVLNNVDILPVKSDD